MKHRVLHTTSNQRTFQRHTTRLLSTLEPCAACHTTCDRLLENIVAFRVLTRCRSPCQQRQGAKRATSRSSCMRVELPDQLHLHKSQQWSASCCKFLLQTTRTRSWVQPGVGGTTPSSCQHSRTLHRLPLLNPSGRGSIDCGTILSFCVVRRNIPPVTPVPLTIPSSLLGT